MRLFAALLVAWLAPWGLANAAEGDLEQRLEQLERSLAALSAALERHGITSGPGREALPDDPDLAWSQLVEWARRGDPVAIEGLREFAARWPERKREADFELGRLLQRLGRDQAALQVFHELIDRSPLDARARVHRALLLRRLGRGDQAERELAVVARIAPELSADLVLELRDDLGSLGAAQALPRPGTNAPRDWEERLEELATSVDEIDEELLSLRDGRLSGEGTTHFLLTGNASLAYTDDDEADSSFQAVLRPHLHWRFSDRLLFESHLDVALEQDETEVELEFANLGYIINDHATLQVGQFLTPFGYYQERVHTAWLNRLPDEPRVVSDRGLAPTNSIGVLLKGVVPTPVRWNYALWASNGPRVNLGLSDPSDAGRLEYDNYSDVNHNKALGARVGWAPWPGLELGYSFLEAKVGPEGTPFEDLRARISGLDLTWAHSSTRARGDLRLHSEWVRSQVDAADYGAGVFDNERRGAYLQLDYRPSLVDSNFWKSFETVLRYDWMNMPSGGPLFDTREWTLGLNYWIGPSTGLKAAYRWSLEERPTGNERDGAVLFEGFIGF